MSDRDLVFLHCGRMPHCQASVNKHFDGYTTLQFMSEGSVEVGYDHDVYRLDGCWYWPAFPGPRITMRRAPGCRSWVHRYVAFRGPLVAEWHAQGLIPPRPQPAAAGGTHVSRFDALIAAVRAPGQWEHRRAVALLEQALIDLAETRRAPTAARPPWLSTALDLLDRAPYHPAYDSIADACAMSVRALRAGFRRHTGTTIHAYVIQRRIARARTLLGESTTPIKAIAAQLGYDDVFYLTKQFKQHTGVTPGVYRRSGMGGER